MRFTKIVAGVLWIGTARGLVRLDPAKKNVEHYPVADKDNSVYGVASDAEGKVWVAYAGRLRRFDPITQKFIGGWTWPEPGTVLPSGNQAIYTDRNGMLWVGTPAGLRLFDPKSGQWMSLRHDPTDRYSLSGNDVLSVNADREGNVWVGVKGAGVNRFSPEHMRFGAWRRDPSDPDGLSDSNVRAIYQGPFWRGLDRNVQRRPE